jgi:hypothetical protein
MKHTMTIVLLMISGIGYQTTCLASERNTQRLDQAAATIKGPDAQQLFNKALDDIPGLLKYYVPAGAKISEQTVIDKGPRGLPRVSFRATKTVLFKNISMMVRGDVSRRFISCAAPANAEGVRIEIELTDSDAAISDHIQTFFVDICITPTNNDIDITGTSFVTGPDLNSLIGDQIKAILRQQTQPLVQALLKLTDKYRRLKPQNGNA